MAVEFRLQKRDYDRKSVFLAVFSIDDDSVKLKLEESALEFGRQPETFHLLSQQAFPTVLGTACIKLLVDTSFRPPTVEITSLDWLDGGYVTAGCKYRILVEDFPVDKLLCSYWYQSDLGKGTPVMVHPVTPVFDIHPADELVVKGALILVFAVTIIVQPESVSVPSFEGRTLVSLAHRGIFDVLDEVTALNLLKAAPFLFGEFPRNSGDTIRLDLSIMDPAVRGRTIGEWLKPNTGCLILYSSKFGSACCTTFPGFNNQQCESMMAFWDSLPSADHLVVQQLLGFSDEVHPYSNISRLRIIFHNVEIDLNAVAYHLAHGFLPFSIAGRIMLYFNCEDPRGSFSILIDDASFRSSSWVGPSIVSEFRDYLQGAHPTVTWFAFGNDLQTVQSLVCERMDREFPTVAALCSGILDRDN